MNKVLGTPFEISLRILLLLEESDGQGFTAGMIAALDFVSVYARDFDLSDANLHGNGDYRFGEFAARRELVKEGTKQLVLDGTVLVRNTKRGFEYVLSRSGQEFAANLESAYADAYRAIASRTIATMREKSEHDLYELINQRAIASLRRE